MTHNGITSILITVVQLIVSSDMLEASSNMDPPRNEGDMKPTNLEEVKEEGPLFSCNLFDAEMVRKVAQEFLTGLASACVDNTTGGLFKSPASMAVDIRREMVDYLIQRSETFVAESVVLEGGTETIVSDNPYDNISDFIDDFGQSKRNFFSRVSGWLLSERREDRIDDFVQEMEINGFWLMARRETVAQTVIRNVDFKNTFHCNMKSKSEEELARHVISCGFREIHCENEGCNARFSAAQHEQHDSECPFKILQCEQKCPEMLMRREMDRHCITICTMKLVNCSFYPVGCQSTVPQCKADEHRKENLQSHLVYILKLIYKEASSEALKKRAQQLEQVSYEMVCVTYTFFEHSMIQVTLCCQFVRFYCAQGQIYEEGWIVEELGFSLRELIRGSTKFKRKHISAIFLLLRNS